MFLSRYLAERLPWWDQRRTAIMGTNAILIAGPLGITVQLFLERWFPGRDNKTIFKKMFINTALAPFLISVTFTSVALMKGKSLHEAQEKVKADVMPTFVMGGLYWPFVNFLNFKYVPLVYRPAVGSAAGTLWSIVMSNQVNKDVVVPVPSPTTTTTTTSNLSVADGGPMAHAPPAASPAEKPPGI
eukprot:GEZU01008049.1.p1 GENE.GEZU01008049.1~~GEZU01008049.1.p1  ORF type:complete len:208 (-),score=45.37 GEZU01008049.1:159-716(-)